MKVIHKYKCPECGGTFKWPGGQEPPDYCPLKGCGAYVGVDPDFVPTRMNIGTSVSRAADDTYRQIEQSSQVRATMAEENMTRELQASGLGYEEASKQAAEAARQIKVTNLNDNVKEGETYAKPVNNFVSQFSQGMKEQVGFEHFQGGAQTYVKDAGGGGLNGTGASVLAHIQGGSPTPQAPRIQGKWGG